MKKFICLILALFISTGLSFSADLDLLKVVYEDELEAINSDYIKKIFPIVLFYEHSLRSLANEAIEAGDIKTAEAAAAEIERFSTNTILTKEDAKNSIPTLKKVQAPCIEKLDTLETTKAEKILALVKKYDSALAKLQTSLTKQNKLSEAGAIRDERKKVAESEEVKTANSVIKRNAQSTEATTSMDQEKPPSKAMLLALKKGLILHYNFDLYRKGSARDKSGKSYHGRVYGAPSKVKRGKDTALSFDGEKDYIDIPDNSRLRKLPDSDFSLCAWFKPNVAPARKHDKGFAAIIARQGYHLGLFYRADEKFEAKHWFDLEKKSKSSISSKKEAWYDIGAANSGNIKYLSVLSDKYGIGEWYHVVETASVKDKTIKLYVNGEMVSEAKWPHQWTSLLDDRNGWKVGIGEPKSTSNRCAANGDIDDVRIYERTLSENEIQALYKITKH